MVCSFVHSQTYFPLLITCRTEVRVNLIELICTYMNTLIGWSDIPIVHLRDVLIHVIGIQIQYCRHLGHHPKASGNKAFEAQKGWKIPLNINSCVRKELPMDSVRCWNIQHLGGTKSCHHRQLVFTNGHCGFVFGIEREDICGWYVLI